MATYYRVPGGFIAVTAEGPRKGPMKGMVLVGRGPRPGGDHTTVHEQAFAIAELQKLSPVNADEVPDPWLEAFGYDWPRPAPPAEEIRVNFLPEVFEPKPAFNSPPRFGWMLAGLLLFTAAVIFFRWLKG